MNKKKLLITAVAAAIIMIMAGAGYVLTHRNDGDDFPETWSQARKDVRPQLVTRAFAEEQRIISGEVSDVIAVAYVLHRGDSYQFVTTELLDYWGGTPQDLQNIAIENMEKIAENDNPELVEAENPNDKYIVVETMDGYSAVRMILPEFRAKIEEALGDTFVAAVPTRDFLIFWKQGFSLENQFAGQVRKEYQDAGPDGLTPELFRFSPKGLEMHPNPA